MSLSFDPPPPYGVHATTPQARTQPNPSATNYVQTTTTSTRYQAVRGPGEYTPLIPTPTQERPGRYTLLLKCIAGILVAVFIAQNAGLVRCPLNDISAEDKAEFRRQWSEEKARLRREWNREWAAHRTEVADARRAWAAEQEAHRIEAAAWTRERAEHVDEVAGWQRDRDEHGRELEDWARQRAEEEAHRTEVKRRSQGVYWTEPLGDAHCHAYGTRTYYSWLRDLPHDLNWLEVCYNMPPVSVHGRTYTAPDKCERNGRGETIGTWYVSGGEPTCVPRWGDFSDKGCVPGKPGHRRFVAPIEAIPGGSDTQMMCSTTPTTIRGVTYDSPTACEWWGRTMMGIWDVPDTTRWCA
ncbi:hypothetical protein C2E23DRAFT_834057 [Lenzites betulinus]|nr:hypothetical protein C2E23DRAFT_834057 [Lenzites betulinus]